MRQDTDKEKETDRVKQLVLVRKKKSIHTPTCVLAQTRTHIHTIWTEKKNFSGLHADSSPQVPTTGGSRAVGLKHAALIH